MQRSTRKYPRKDESDASITRIQYAAYRGVARLIAPFRAQPPPFFRLRTQDKKLCHRPTHLPTHFHFHFRFRNRFVSLIPPMRPIFAILLLSVAARAASVEGPLTPEQS